MDLSNIGTDISLKQLQGQSSLLPGSDSAEKTPGETLSSFGQILKDSLKQVDSTQQAAEAAKETYAVGGDIELHQVMVAVERADVAMQMTMQIKNKLVAAYQEIDHMSV